jgi:hypothetical protein
MENDFSYEVTEEVGIIGNPTPSGWTTQLNLVSWNGKEPKLDIRSWNPDHSRMGKGISLSKEDATELANLLNSYLGLGSQEDFERPLTKEEMLAEMASMLPEEMSE